ncbi:hypothetical protein SCD_n01565 [Sulfuricella denitrificans skB26]|uniref:Surface-adhesin protein E-like domain-containing protein n=2 Tax=Sulfuricella denitrificans TaxID=649841 RepID=S6AH24_SULDS|nr:hypothetical protein SCD_n01565 [Sulfuricella denitrificans skB26]
MNPMRSKLMQNVFRFHFGVAVLGMAAAFSAQAVDWAPVTQVGDSVREIDPSSIVGTAPVFTYTTRHVFGDLEYRVGRRGIKYLVISSKSDCRRQTTSRLTVDAYDENMSLVSKQTIQNPEETLVSPDSIEEAVLKFVCQPK